MAVNIECHLGVIRDELDALLPSLSTLRNRLSQAFGPAVSTDGEGSAIRLHVDGAYTDSHQIPETHLVNMHGLHKALRELLPAETKHDLGINHVGILFADRYRNDDGLFGLMFDDGFHGASRARRNPRQGCAVFLRAIAHHRAEDNVEKEALFTAGHELGHVFNLWHTSDPTSFMSRPRSESAWPSYYQSFHATHRRFLSHCGESAKVHPGGSEWGDRGDLGPTGGDPESRTRRATGPQLQISTYEKEIWAFEPIELDVRLRLPKTRRSSLRLPNTFDPGYDRFALWVERPDGTRTRYKPPRYYCGTLTTQKLSPGETWQRDLSVFGQSGGYTFAAPGEYSLRVSWQVSERCILQSNAVRFFVKPGLFQFAWFRELRKVMQRTDVAELLFYRTLSSHRKEAELLAAVGERKSAKDFRGALHYALGRAYAERVSRSKRRRRVDEQAARRHLSEAAEAFPSHIHRHQKAVELLTVLADRTE
jgi:hypothetical protein